MPNRNTRDRIDLESIPFPVDPASAREQRWPKGRESKPVVGEVTEWLRAWSDGDQESLHRLMPLVYDELRNMAARYLGGESPGTLQPTALVNEAFFRLIDQKRVRWQDRSHFFAIAARLMRRIIVDHARSRQSVKRGGIRVKVPLEDAGEATEVRPAELVALDDALSDLARLDPEKATLVELRFYGGLSFEETAEVLGCSRMTVVRHWKLAKAWLHHELTRAGDDS